MRSVPTSMRALLMPMLMLMAGASAVASEPGAGVYAARCGACHHPSGQGTPGLAPAVADVLSPLFASADGRRYVVQVLVHGLSGRIVSQGQVFVGAMPAQAMLSDAELADVANHLARQLNASTAPAFTADDFAGARRTVTAHKDLRALRARLLP
jgi:mono/diheme cytochrome c family protein